MEKTVVCFGEVLWDVYPEGKKLGGAPFNVAAHLYQLGTSSHIISRVGEDDLGSEILKQIAHQNINTAYTQIDPQLITGVVSVLLENGIPTYDIKQPSAWDAIELNAENKTLVKASQALVYGTLACRDERSKSTLLELLKLSELNICDLNIRQAYYSAELIAELLSHTQVLKINDEEAELLAKLFDFLPENLYAYLSQAFGIELIILTLGKDGAKVLHKEGSSLGASFQIQVVDTVGSGDAFLAAFIHHYLNGDSLTQAITEACRLGAYVATQSGAIPQYSPKDLAAIQ